MPPKSPKDKKIKCGASCQPDIRTIVRKMETEGDIDIKKLEQEAKTSETTKVLLAFIRGEL
jgi:hypothetical protein